MYVPARCLPASLRPPEQSLATAVARLRADLPRLLDLPRGDHVGTLLVFGAVAGVAAQEAALRAGCGRTMPADTLRLSQPGYAAAELDGAAIQARLIGAAPDTLWSQLDLVGREAGLPARSMPDPVLIARQVANGGGDAWFGRLDVPGGRPVCAPRDVVTACAWSAATPLLRLDGPVFAPIPISDWVAVTALAAAEAARAALAPLGGAPALALVLGAALVTARRHPQRHAPGRWRIEQGANGRLAVAEMQPWDSGRSVPEAGARRYEHALMAF